MAPRNEITETELNQISRVMDAARGNDIDTLYQIIGEDVNVLKRIDEMDITDTPLHIASEAGNTDFAMEMMYLKPSFATKLNKNGLSPLHLALQNGHTKLALSMLGINKDLARIKGKMGYTPLHYLVMTETRAALLKKFLNTVPQCISDVTTRDETALHVAASKNPSALKVLLKWFRITNNYSMLQKDKILNFINRDKETVMHVAALNKDGPDPEIFRLLTGFRYFNTQARSSNRSKALDILNDRIQENIININIQKCRDILLKRRALPAIIRKFCWFLVELVLQWAYEIRYMSSEKGNALLVVTVLILTATYQSTLSPPGGVLPKPSAGPNNNSKFSGLETYFGSKNTGTSTDHIVEEIRLKENNKAGSSVLETSAFVWFFIPNMVAFLTAFILTCIVLLSIYSGFLSFTLLLSLSTLLFCLLDSALIILSPNNKSCRILVSSVYVLVCVTVLAIAPTLVPKVRGYFQFKD